MLLIFLIGLGFFLYPYVSRIIIGKKVNDNIQVFEEERDKFIEEAIENGKLPNADKMPVDDEGKPAPYKVVLTNPEPAEEQPYLDKLYQYMRRRNKELFDTNQKSLNSSSSYMYPEINLKDYGITSQSIGTLEIEKLDLKLSIFLGANDDNMMAGCGHLTNTSYPIGGTNTNCVIAVHRGLGGSDFLRYVEKLETGDIVRIENFWYTLEYKVTGIKIIEPDDVKPILIKNGRDMLTLYTCHPYGVNSQRYLVYCERIVK
ncbi:MAG: class C sortase [Ruminococcus sp.]|uniref:class C sortase n=1 Tax=Ruminococcus sp. TaxID=41978 RepID=UPI001B0118CC|nr:class C sortase [Ruminococcus sp.]MBO7472403.1 class C sortase [Ruminococcus sp.]